MPKKKVRNFFNRFFLILNIIVSVTFLLTYLVPYLNPAHWWFMGLVGLAFPYMGLLLIFFIIFWGVIKIRWTIISIVSLLLGYSQLKVLFATNKLLSFTEKKDSSYIRIVDWNIRSFTGIGTKADRKHTDRTSISQAIIAQNPDVICLQEFNNSDIQNNISLFLPAYKYFFFSRDFHKEKFHYQTGNIIFSKYPIVDSGKVAYSGPEGGSLIFADIQTPKKIFRMFTTHLQSFRFKPEDYESMEEIKNTGDRTIPASKSILQKMKLAYTKRGEQANVVRKELDLSDYPSVICGDFNDVPNSYTYFHIRHDRQDVFLASSLGIGRSYLALAPTLRIDYILPDNNFDIRQFDLVDEDLSDHLMLVTDIAFK